MLLPWVTSAQCPVVEMPRPAWTTVSMVVSPFWKVAVYVVGMMPHKVSVMDQTAGTTPTSLVWVAAVTSGFRWIMVDAS